jgi:hypothetical protein
MCYTPETLLNHVFEDLRKTKAPNKGLEPVVRLSWLLSPYHGKPPKLAFHQFHLCDHGGIITLMRDLEGIPYLLGIVQAADLVIFIPA